MTPSKKASLLALAAGAVAAPALAFVGFVTISPRQKVSALVYNGEDLTLVRDVRRAVFKQGPNLLRYQWANTLIDPTSLETFAPPGVKLQDTTYPLGEGESLVWNFDSARQVSGPLTVQYFTSGLSWRADHLVTLTAPGKARLETWVRVDNHSGEDFENTQFSLVVGEVRLIETIRELAGRFKPQQSYGQTPEAMPMSAPAPPPKMMMRKMARPADGEAHYRNGGGGYDRPKEVARESLSELHVYHIEGTENVPTGGGRRMRAFAYDNVSVTDTYRCNDPGENTEALRVLTFANTKENKLGVQPLPEGTLQLFKQSANGLSYEGRGDLPYTPMKEKAETPLGYGQGVRCKALVKNMRRENIRKDGLGRITGWEDVTDHQVTLVNGGASPAAFELRQHHDAPFSANLKEARKEDVRTLLQKTTVPPRGKKTFTYTVRVRRGELANG